jgi:hypothetical protein
VREDFLFEYGSCVCVAMGVAEDGGAQDGVDGVFV